MKKLFLGTYEGHILVYEVIEKDRKVSLQLFDTKQLSKKPITQMTILEPFNILVILTDGEIKAFDILNGYASKGTLLKAKGCNIYAISQNGTYLSLCAAVKKKLVLYSWDGTEFVESKELNIPESTKTLDYRDNYIVVSFKKSYNIINTQDGSAINVETDKVSYLTFFQEKEFLIVKNKGTPNRKYGLTWSDAPVSLTISYPFVLSIEARQVEIQIVPESKTSSKTISQTMFINGGRSITSKKDIYISSNFTVWRLVPVEVLDLVDQLVSNNEFETAINFLNTSPDTLVGKREKLSKIRISAAYHAFSREQYQSAMDLFLSASFDPLKVISLYPGFLPPLLQEKLSVTVQIKDIEKNDNALSALDCFLLGIRKELQKPDKPPYNLNPPELLNSGYDLPTLIDTTILKVYIKIKPNLISVFFNLKNCLHIEESQRVLIEEKKLNELVLFYQSKAMHREALTLLAKNGVPHKTPEHHNLLIFEYLGKITTLCNDPLVRRGAPGEDTAGSEPGLLGPLRTKLIGFLQSSKYYLPEKMLSRFPFAGRHEQALSIYAHKLKNFRMAEDYCDRNYNRDSEESRDVYLSLLTVYLKPETNAKPLIEPALNLLNKHYRSINTPKALSLLPLTIPIQELYPFFEAVIRENTKTKRDNQIIKNLFKAEHVKIKEELIHLRAGVIKITDDLICPFCRKRFVGTNAFAAQPNGTAIHYVCFQNQQTAKNLSNGHLNHGHGQDMH
eukprot:gene11193-13048_t